MTALAQATTAELRKELADALSLTAEHLTYLGAIWRELERRGEDLSELKSGMGFYLAKIASGELLAETVVKYAGDPGILRRMGALSLDKQRAALTTGKLPFEATKGRPAVRSDGANLRPTSNRSVPSISSYTPPIPDKSASSLDEAVFRFRQLCDQYGHLPELKAVVAEIKRLADRDETVQALTPEQRALIDEFTKQYETPAKIAWTKHKGHAVALLKKGLVTEDDIEQLAWLGVIRAAKTFDPARGVEFATHVSHSIRGALSRPFADAEAAKRMPPGGSVLSIDAASDDEGSTCADSIKYPEVDDEEPPAELSDEMKSLLEIGLASLPDRYRDVVKMRYGIGCEPLTLREIGERIGLTKERVRQMEEQSVVKLKKRFAAEMDRTKQGAA